MIAIEELVPDWLVSGVVEALRSLRGVALIGAATFKTEVADVRRLEHANPPQRGCNIC